MPARHTHREDPLFDNVHGSEHTNPKVFNRDDMGMPARYRPPPMEPAATKTAKYMPQTQPPEDFGVPLTSGSSTPEPYRPHRARYRSPSPPPYDPPSRDRSPDQDHGRRRQRHDPAPPRHDHHETRRHRSDDDSPPPRRRRSPPPSHLRPDRPGLSMSKTAPVPPALTSPARHSHRRPRSTSPPPPRHNRTQAHDAQDGPDSRHSDPAGKRRPAPRRSKTTSINYNEFLRSQRFHSAAAAALQAGSAQAIKMSQSPGPWSGEKGARIAGAALSAAALDAITARAKVKEERSKRSGGGGGHGDSSANVGSALGGLLAGRLSRSRGSGSKRR